MKRGHPQFEPRWPNTKAIKIGWLAGRGTSSSAIEQILGDGTTSETIRTMLLRSELEAIGRNRSIIYVPVRLTVYERGQLSKRAAPRGMPLEEWMRNVVVNAGIPDDLYSSIVEVDE